MRRLKTLASAPPVDSSGQSYRFTHETGHTSRAMDWWTWEKKIREHREGNGLPIPPNMMAIAEDQLCGSIPPDLCQYEAGDQRPVDTRITFDNVKDWMASVLRARLRWLSGKPWYVEQAEAERRAAICVGCPYNVMLSGGCGRGCHKLTELLTPGMAKRHTKQDHLLKSCGICACYNGIQVHFPLTLLAGSDRDDIQTALPNFCWKKTGGENCIVSCD